MTYLLDTLPSRTRTPQSEPLRGQKKNSSGGFSFPVTDRVALERFLILGSQGGSYYATEKDLTKQNREAVVREIRRDGIGTVLLVQQISQSGRAVKNDPALFVLALALTQGSTETKQAASGALRFVARTGTHLLHFVAYMDALRGWGKLAREAVSSWYLSKPAEQLAYQVVKYPQRDGWSHKDAIRLAHPKAINEHTNQVLGYVAKGRVPGETIVGKHPMDVIFASELAKVVSEKEIGNLFSTRNLPWEAVPTEKRTPKVYEAYLSVTPITWLIRNLGNLSKHGVLKEGQYKNLGLAIDKLTNKEVLKAGRVHPLSLLIALNTYKKGAGVRGSSTWPVIPAICGALEEAYELSFAGVESTGLRYLNALDVSSSMRAPDIAGMPGISPAIGSGAMAHILNRTEDRVVNLAFTSSSGYGRIVQSLDGVSLLHLGKRDNLETVQRKITGLPFGGTDCSLPMLWATANKVEVDVFVVYTDSETWTGTIQPVEALRDYRKSFGIPAKLVVVGMVANEFSLASPDDSGMLDVCGFDSSFPKLLAEFAKG